MRPVATQTWLDRYSPSNARLIGLLEGLTKILAKAGDPGPGDVLHDHHMGNTPFRRQLILFNHGVARFLEHHDVLLRCHRDFRIVHFIELFGQILRVLDTSFRLSRQAVTTFFSENVP